MTIGAGMTIVMYDNEPFVPQGNGYIEVCKDRALLDYNEYDWAVQGSFHFTITDQLGASTSATCSRPVLGADRGRRGYRARSRGRR